MTDKAIEAAERAYLSVATEVDTRAMRAAIAAYEQASWISVEDKLPPPRQNVWCLNRDGRQFEGRMRYGMHKPFFTYPYGDGNASNTAPSWIDVTHYRPLPPPPGKEG